MKSRIQIFLYVKQILTDVNNNGANKLQIWIMIWYNWVDLPKSCGTSSVYHRDVKASSMWYMKTWLHVLCMIWLYHHILSVYWHVYRESWSWLLWYRSRNNGVIIASCVYWEVVYGRCHITQSHYHHYGSLLISVNNLAKQFGGVKVCWVGTYCWGCV